MVWIDASQGSGVAYSRALTFLGISSAHHLDANPMSFHRFSHLDRPFRLPRPAAPVPAPGAFLAVPLVAFLPAQLMIYQAAWEQARAVVQPSLPERDLLACWN
jgi:hypothetical protein